MKKYRIYISGRMLESKSGSGSYNWQKGSGDDEKIVESHNTLKECFDSMAEWGSRWAMYPSVWIECKEDGEVWESTAAITKCKHCKHEEWDNMSSGQKLHNGKLISIDKAIELGI